jgi:TonB-dependent starch-binding outer membrane protein SusC
MRNHVDYLLKGKKRLFFLAFFTLVFSTLVIAQNRVSGKVTGPDGKPVFGATVGVKGTNVATTTTTDGSYAITLPHNSNVLVFSYIGFEVSEVNVRGNNTIDVSMKLQTTSLNEVVVTGYTAQRKKDITGAVAVVNVAQMKQSPVGTGEEALQGRASGVTIITSGQPGAQSDIRIRGITAFGNNAPLIIVDGVRSSLHDINTNDIESIQVLKDASAAIYGVAGSNGVIIVTTKKGRTGRAKVSYDGYYGITTHGNGIEMANTQEEANAIWLQFANSGTAPKHKQFGTGATPVIPDYIQTYPYPNPADPTKTINSGYTLCNCPADAAIVDPNLYDINSAQITKANKSGTNWYNEITRNAPMQSHNISVSAGSDKSSYFFSMGYLNQQGIAKFQYLKRYSIRANTQFSIKDHIRVGENFYAYYRENPIYGQQSEGSPFTTAVRESAIIPVYDIVGNFAGTKSQDLGNSGNPFAQVARTASNKSRAWDITGSVFAEVDFLRHFNFRTTFGGLMDNNYGYAFNYVAYENAEGNTGANSFGENSGYNTNWTWNNLLTYTNAIKEHNFRVLAGTEAVNNYGRYMSANRSGYFSENPDYWVLGAGTGSQANDGGAYQSTLASYFGKVEYSYAGKYLINASLRRDGASVFAEDVRWGTFPGVSAAWVISQENFFKTVSFVNNLKLRYSWAKLGSTSNVQSTNPYDLYASRLGRSAYDIAGNSTGPVAGFFLSSIGNPATTWEEDIITNAGFDATILNNKLDVSFDWYKKKVSGLLFTAQGPQYDIIYGGGDAALPKVNIGDMQNTGVDANVTYHGSAGKDFKFDVGLTFTSYKNKIVDIPGLNYYDEPVVRNNILQREQEGQPFGSFFGYEVIGLFQSADDISKSPTQTDAKPGLFKYRDVNNDGKIDNDDRAFIGNPNPDFEYGLNISFSYKNFDFSSFFFGSAGNDIFNNLLYFTDFPDFFKGGIRKEVALNSWTPTNTDTKIPSLQTTGGFSSDQSSYANSYFISKGSYFRAKQMQIGYTLPGNLLSKYGIERLRIYVQAANLFTITNYEGVDPELQSQPNSSGQIINTYQFGIDQGTYPHTPSFLFGVNLNF